MSDLNDYASGSMIANVREASFRMIEKLEKYTSLINTELTQLSSILDPRIKGTEREQLILRRVFTDRFGNNFIPEKVSKDYLSRAFKRQQVEIEDEVSLYFKLPVVSHDTDIVQWWTERSETQFVNLSKIAFDIICIPGSSVPSEQSFSKAGNLVTKRRNRLESKMIQSQMCLNSWYKLFD